jgi:hypothetical protein
LSNEEFFSFDEALSELRLKEEELKRLVSEGEIRAFREGDTMKLRRGDVEALRSELGGGEVVDLGEPSEELVFEDDSFADAGMATEEISEVDTIIEDDIEDDIEDVGEIEIEEEVVAAAPVRRAGAASRSSAKEEEGEPMGIRAAMIITALVLIAALPVMFSVSEGEANGIAKGIASMFFGDKFQ